MTHHAELPASVAVQLGFENLRCLRDLVIYQSRCCVKSIFFFFFFFSLKDAYFTISCPYVAQTNTEME